MVSKEFKVGLLALVAGVVLYIGFNYLKGIELLSNTNTYYAKYDRIDGLQVSNPILINGMPIGRVSSIEILQEDQNQLKVGVEVREDIKVGVETVALLTDGDLLGGKVIELQISNTLPLLEDGADIRSNTGKGLTDLMKEKALPVLANFDSTIHTLNQLASEYKGMSVEVRKTMQNVEGATKQVNLMLEDNRIRVAQILKTVDELSTSLSETEKEMKPLISNMKVLSDSLKQAPIAATVTETKLILAELKESLEALNNAEGSMGLLLKDDSLYRNMDQTIRDLDSLFIDMKDRPGRYVQFSVFGKKDKDKKKKNKK